MKRSIIPAFGVIALAAAAFAGSLAKVPTEARAFAYNTSVYLDLSHSEGQSWIEGVDDTNSDEGSVVIGMNAWSPAIKIRGNRVRGFDNDNKYLYEFVFDAPSYSGLLFFRGNGSLTGGWYNQTYDWGNFNSAEKNVWKITSNGEKYGMENSWNVSYTDRAGYYATYFIEKTNDSCDDKEAPSADGWTELEREYNAMNGGAKAIVAASSDASVTEAIKRYDIIVKKYHLKDFLNRHTGGGGSGAGVVSTVGGETSVTAIAVTASVGLVGAAGLFFVRRRRIL